METLWCTNISCHYDEQEREAKQFICCGERQNWRLQLSEEQAEWGKWPVLQATSCPCLGPPWSYSSQSLCWCSWSILPPKVVQRPMVCVVTWSHADVQRPCCVLTGPQHGHSRRTDPIPLQLPQGGVLSGMGQGELAPLAWTLESWPWWPGFGRGGWTITTESPWLGQQQDSWKECQWRSSIAGIAEATWTRPLQWTFASKAVCVKWYTAWHTTAPNAPRQTNMWWRRGKEGGAKWYTHGGIGDKWDALVFSISVLIFLFPFVGVQG